MEALAYHQRLRRERLVYHQELCAAAQAACDEEWRVALNEEQALAARRSEVDTAQLGDADTARGAVLRADGQTTQVDVAGDVDQEWAALFASDDGRGRSAATAVTAEKHEQRRQRRQQQPAASEDNAKQTQQEATMVVTLAVPQLPAPPLSDGEWVKQLGLFRDAVCHSLARLLGVFPGRFRDITPHKVGKSVDVCIVGMPSAAELARICVRAQPPNTPVDDDAQQQRQQQQRAGSSRALVARPTAADGPPDNDNIFGHDWNTSLGLTKRQRAQAKTATRAAGNHEGHYACSPCSVVCPFCERAVVLTGLVPHMIACGSKTLRQQRRVSADAPPSERVALQYPYSCAEGDKFLSRHSVLQDADPRPSQEAKRRDTTRADAFAGSLSPGVLVLHTPIAHRSTKVPAAQLARELFAMLQTGPLTVAGLRVNSIAFPFGDSGIARAETERLRAVKLHAAPVATAPQPVGAAAKLLDAKAQLKYAEQALSAVAQLAEQGTLARARDRARRLWGALRMALVVIRQLQRHDLHFTCNPCSKLCEICGRGILIAGYRFHRKKCRIKTTGLVASDPREENKVSIEDAVRRECAASLVRVDDDQLTRKLREQRRIDYLEWRYLKRPVPPVFKENVAANDMAGCRKAAERVARIQAMVVAPMCYCRRAAVMHSDPRGEKVKRWSEEHVRLSSTPPPISGMGSFWACSRRDPTHLAASGSCTFFEWYDGNMLTNPAAKSTRAAFVAPTPATALVDVVDALGEKRAGGTGDEEELSARAGASQSDSEDNSSNSDAGGSRDQAGQSDTRTKQRVRQHVDVSRAMASHESHYSCHPCTVMCAICETPVVVSGLAQHDHACKLRHERHRIANDLGRDVFVATASEYPLAQVCLDHEARQPHGRLDAMLRQRRHDAWVESKRTLAREHKHRGPGDTGHYTCSPCSIKCPVCDKPVLVHGFERHRAACKKLADQQTQVKSEGISVAGALAQQYPYSTSELEKFERRNPLARHRRELVGILHRSEKEAVRGDSDEEMPSLKSDHSRHIDCNGGKKGPCRVKCDHCNREVLANSYELHREQCERLEHARHDREKHEKVRARKAHRDLEMEALNNYARLALCPSSVRATSSERRQLALLNYLETAQLPLTTNPAERKVAPAAKDLLQCGPFKVPAEAGHGATGRAVGPSNLPNRNVQRRQKTARQKSVTLHTTQRSQPAFMCRSGQFATSFAECIVATSQIRELQPGDRITAINDDKLPTNASLENVNAMLRTTCRPIRLSVERQRQNKRSTGGSTTDTFTAVCEKPSLLAVALQARQ